MGKTRLVRRIHSVGIVLAVLAAAVLAGCGSGGGSTGAGTATGAPAASSGTFPIGTTLKVTNLDNNKSITVKVTETSGSCALLNDAAFNQIHEAGKFLIRHATIERVG